MPRMHDPEFVHHGAAVHDSQDTLAGVKRRGKRERRIVLRDDRVRLGRGDGSGVRHGADDKRTKHAFLEVPHAVLIRHVAHEEIVARRQHERCVCRPTRPRKARSAEEMHPRGPGVALTTRAEQVRGSVARIQT